MLILTDIFLFVLYFKCFCSANVSAIPFFFFFCCLAVLEDCCDFNKHITNCTIIYTRIPFTKKKKIKMYKFIRLYFKFKKHLLRTHTQNEYIDLIFHVTNLFIHYLRLFEQSSDKTRESK